VPILDFRHLNHVFILSTLLASLGLVILSNFSFQVFHIVLILLILSNDSFCGLSET
jgi:hypothetical protein